MKEAGLLVWIINLSWFIVWLGLVVCFKLLATKIRKSRLSYFLVVPCNQGVSNPVFEVSIRPVEPIIFHLVDHEEHVYVDASSECKETEVGHVK